MLRQSLALQDQVANSGENTANDGRASLMLSGVNGYQMDGRIIDGWLLCAATLGVGCRLREDSLLVGFNRVSG